MPNLQFSKGRWSLTIPFEMVAAKGWAKGQRLLCNFNAQGNIELSELKPKAK